jgi:IMP dehydrogenase/GMP reductase
MKKIKLLEKKLKQMNEGITFDDVLLLPNYTDFKRNEVDLSVDLHPLIKLKIPIISSPMDTVTEEKMAQSMAENGALGIIHRNLSIEKQVLMVKKVKSIKTDDEKAAVDEKNRLLVGAALGVGEDFFERAKALVKTKVDLLVLDSGHGFSKFILRQLYLSKKIFLKYL